MELKLNGVYTVALWIWDTDDIVIIMLCIKCQTHVTIIWEGTLSFRNSSHSFFFFSCIYYNKLPKKLFIVFIFLIFSLGIRFIAEMDISCIQFLYMLLLLAILDNQLHFLYVRMNVYFVLFRKLVRACVTDISKNRVDFWKN